MILKHRDRELLRFEWLEPQGVRVLSVVEENRRFLPLEMKGRTDDEALWTWLKHRAVPRNRRNVEVLLASLGLNAKDVRGIIGICRGLSLNDVHWVVADGFSGAWKDNNLYENKFSETIAQIVFNQSGSPLHDVNWTSSPEFTTNGMLAKCWRRINGEILLYKSGTTGAANAGFEPYSEFYAAQIAEALGLPHVDYGLAVFKKILCSTCPLFTSDKYGYLPAGRFVSKEEALNDPRFADIFLFDALIFNTDRHMGNFGYLVDNDTNEIVGAAPIFDNGYGLFSLAVASENVAFDEFKDLRLFAARVMPALYTKWLGYPSGLTADQIRRLEPLRTFRFKRHKYHNLPSSRLNAIEDFIRNRVAKIIECGESADEFLKISKDCVTVNPQKRSLVDTGSVEANMKADPFVTADELADLLGVSRRTVLRAIAKLRQEGRIARVGSDKTGHWVVADTSLNGPVNQTC